jgi:putative transposase
MIERRGFENQLEPSWSQEQLLRRFVGGRRWVWNWALALQKSCLDQGLKLHSFAELCKLLTELRNAPDTGWLYEGPTHTQQAALRDLCRAFERWRAKKGGMPKFKRRGVQESIRYPDCKQIKFQLRTQDEQGRQVLPQIFLPKVGWVKIRLSRPLVGKVCNVTVRLSAGRWIASIQTEFELEVPILEQTEQNTVGGDIGLCHFLVLSNGTTIEAPDHIQRKEKALKTAQRRLSRMQKGSKRAQEQRKRIQKLHQRIACSRKDFLHKTSTTLSKNHAYVKLEDVRVSTMIKTQESDPQGKPTTASRRAKFNRKLLNVGWGTFLHYLDYKLRVRGGGLILVNPAYTSQECSVCGSIAESNRKTRGVFHCLSCHHADHADANAAKVIKKRAGRAPSPSGVACEVSIAGDLP